MRRLNAQAFPRWLCSAPGGNLAPSSVLVYDREARDFLEYISSKRRRFTRPWVEGWIGARQVSPSAAVRALAVVKKLSEFLGLPDPTSGIRRPKAKRGLPRPVEGLAFALRRMESDGEHVLASVCLFLASTGLRVSEACGENGCGFEVIEDGRALRVHGKGSKDRIVPLAAAVPPNTNPVIPYSVKQLQAATRRYGFSPHQLRHLAATNWYRNSGDIFAVSSLLGHASISTTQVYAAMSSDRMRAAIGSQRVTRFGRKRKPFTAELVVPVRRSFDPGD